jgi:ribulose-phosphate 3-epimerase
MRYLAPSILSADFSNLAQQIKYAEVGGADFIHCDIMDGQFVPNITFGPLVVEAVNRSTNLPLDVHLMINNADHFIEQFAKAGADFLTVHQENNIHLDRTVSYIKSLGVKAGVSINPATPVSVLTEILQFADMILVMTVNPGFGAQKFIPSTLKKVEELRNLKEKKGYSYLIEVDGGVNKNTVTDIVNAGCEVFVAGNSVFGSDNISAATMELKNLINR